MCTKVYHALKLFKAFVSMLDNMNSAISQSLTNVCNVCQKVYKNACDMRKHYKAKHGPPELRKTYPCPNCGYEFTRNWSLSEHLRKICYGPVPLFGVTVPNANLLGKIQQLETKIEQNQQVISHIETKIDNVEKNEQEIKDKLEATKAQTLQVVCVSDKDNYLDMLTAKLGNFDRALAIVQECALSGIAGDCRLLNEVYHELPFQTNSKHTQITYFNANKQKIIEAIDSFAKQLANSLQNSYLKGVNHIVKTNLERNACPMRMLENYDISTWNDHIYSLIDNKYQRKVIRALHIPIMGGAERPP